MTIFLIHALGWVLIVIGITAFGMQTWSGMRRIWRAEAGVGGSGTSSVRGSAPRSFAGSGSDCCSSEMSDFALRGR
jgi:hypothetical protein